MNCKQCGGTMTAQNKVIRGRPTTVYECNQDNGSCLNPRGYPNSVFASGNGAQRAPAPRPTPGGSPQAFVSNRDADIKWQVCLKAAATMLATSNANTVGNVTAADVIAYATALFLAPAPKLPPLATVKPVVAQPEEEEVEQVY